MNLCTSTTTSTPCKLSTTLSSTTKDWTLVPNPPTNSTPYWLPQNCSDYKTRRKLWRHNNTWGYPSNRGGITIRQQHTEGDSLMMQGRTRGITTTTITMGDSPTITSRVQRNQTSRTILWRDRTVRTSLRAEVRRNISAINVIVCSRRSIPSLYIKGCPIIPRIVRLFVMCAEKVRFPVIILI